tara:strand:+ start:34 stop:1026 length:993 start_codon:yes stop_codon:yes gene_type:complete
MAITATAQITGQTIVGAGSYCYLYEPLKVDILESDASGRTVSIDLIIYNASDLSVVETISEYGKYDINPNSPIEVDLMLLTQQYHDSNVFKIGVLSDIVSATDIPVSKYVYQFLIYSDVSTQVTATKFPIIGGRDFYDFVPSVLSTQHLTEAELYGVDLTGRWKNYPNISVDLKTLETSGDYTPTISITTETAAAFEPCGGMLIWKSRFGGWMYWGMDIATRTLSKKYASKLESGMFESTDGGNPYIPVDYTKIDTSYSISLKALSLNNDELKAVSGINSSIAVYYMRDSTAKLELMRVASASAPISTLIGGGDFSVSLKSISRTTQKAR